MHQDFNAYLPQDHETWKILFDRQVINLQDKACTSYLDCLAQLKDVLHGESIPRFEELDEKLMAATGWSIEVVPGLIPVAEFFELLSRRRFCSSTWIRQRSQLDYLEEPDMFHDIFGHVPLLIDPVYADFMQQFGEIGTKYAGDPEFEAQMERLYWFTIEFGLIMENSAPKLFGAGILSSFGESRQIFEKDILVRPFEIGQVMGQEFRKDVMQTEYFAISTISELGESLEKAAEMLAIKAKTPEKKVTTPL